MSEPRLWPDGTPFPDEPTVDSDEAERRYRRALDWDPFPEIPEALLNSADVYDYVRVTGMICPFDDKCMKAASYEISIGDRCIYWDDNQTPHDLHLADGQSFILRKNAIVFVTPKEEFRLPHYIALRFNLRITNVHRGILLGTGPLVDPGFAGRLLIPLHNLTTNDYVFERGEGIAWFEFTKTSPHDRWRDDYRNKRALMGLKGEYVAFDEKKKYLEPNDYFEKALRGIHPKVIVSSIPASMLEAERSAKKAEKHARTIRNWAAGLGGFVFLTIAGMLVGIFLASFQLMTGIKDSISENKTSVTEVTVRFNEGLAQIHHGVEALSMRVNRLSDTSEQLRREVDENAAGAAALREQIEGMRSSMDQFREVLDNIGHRDGDG